jgi:L-fucose mutarotase
VLKTTIIHPELVQALAEAGHGARILVADSNYPVSVKVNPAARRVHLNFVPGIVSGPEVVRALVGAVPIESAVYLAPGDGTLPEAVKEYQALLGKSVPLDKLDRLAFYDLAKSGDTALVIATGESRTYACLLLTVGVVAPA